MIIWNKQALHSSASISFSSFNNESRVPSKHSKHITCVGKSNNTLLTSISESRLDMVDDSSSPLSSLEEMVSSLSEHWECVSYDREEQVESVFFDWLVGKSNSKIRSGSVKLLLLETSDK